MINMKHFLTVYKFSPMSRKRYTQSSCKLIITQWQHDTLNNADSEPAANSMALEYEAVSYGRGAVSEGVNPEDPEKNITIEPQLQPCDRGGGTTSVFGTGGVASAFGLFGGQGGPNTDISGGESGRSGSTLGNIPRGANANSKMLKIYPKADWSQEGFNILKGAVGRIGGTADPKLHKKWWTRRHSDCLVPSKFGNTVKALIRK